MSDEPTSPKTNVFGLLFIVAAIFALIVSYIGPLEGEIVHLNNRIETVNKRAIEADHLAEITSISERLNAVSKDIQRVEDTHALTKERIESRLTKLESWNEENSDKHLDICRRLSTLEAEMRMHVHYTNVGSGSHFPDGGK